MIKKIAFIITVIFLTSCYSIKVVNINDAQKYYDNAIIYNLPETVLKIDIEVSKIVFTKGPYCDYAEKYLSISNVKKQNESKWEITNVTINSFSEPDYNNYYLLESNYKALLRKISFTESSILKSINTTTKNNIEPIEYETISKQNIKSKNILFTDMSVKRNNFEVKTIIPQDTSINRPRKIITKIKEKDLQIKAEEAANFIIKTRKRRFRIMANKSKQIPKDGAGIKTMIKELNKLEQKYLELFIGHEYSDTIKYSYTYTPSKDVKTNILTYFSSKYGIYNKNFKGAQAIILKVSNDGKTNVIDSYLAKKEESETKEYEGIIYRIPDLATVQVLKENNIIAQKKLLISQVGTLNIIPKEILLNKNIALEFDVKYGSLKTIGK